MKKNIFIYSLAAVASLTLASCNGDYDDWASPQSHETEASTSKYGLTAAAGADANIVMPLRNDDVTLVTLSTTSEDVAGYNVKSLLVNGEEIDATVSKGNIVVSGDELDNLIQQQFNSRASVKRDIDVEATVSLVLDNGDAVTIDDVLTTQASITPAETPAIDEAGYYLLGDFEGNGWDLATPIWMDKISDGVYMATVTTKSTTSNWFKFYEGSHYSDSNWDVVNLGQMGCQVNGDESLSGFVVFTGDKWEVQTPVIAGQSTFEVTLDMNNLTYSVVRAESQYYVVGNVQGWSDTDKSAMFYSEGGNVYTYTTKWVSSWDLKVWNGKEFGDWNLAWGSTVDGTRDESGSLINSDAQAFASPTAEYYTLSIDMNNQVYSWTRLDNQEPTEYSGISLIGDFNGWGGDIDLEQLANGPHNWYVRAEISSDGGLKFRADHDWTTSWGADVDLSEHYYGTATSDNGPNISVPAGTYDFYFNDITGQFNIVAVE